MFGVSLFVALGLFVAGLLVGWNALPQPKWVKNLWYKVFPSDEGDTTENQVG